MSTMNFVSLAMSDEAPHPRHGHQTQNPPRDFIISKHVVNKRSSSKLSST
jgi:hypothetical protein